MTKVTKITELLQDAMDKVTLDFNGLSYGQELELNDKYTLYHYTDEDIVVINETEEWNEILQVMTNGNEIEFEDLGFRTPEEIEIEVNKILKENKLKEAVRSLLTKINNNMEELWEGDLKEPQTAVKLENIDIELDILEKLINE